MDTHIIHKPPHHQERPPASPVGHRPYNNRLSSTGHQKKRPEGPFSPYAPFPNHRSSLRNGRYHCRSRAVAPHRSIPNRSGGDRQPYTVCMDIMSVHFGVEHMRVLFERLVWQDILTGKTAMHILIGHCAQTNCSDKTYVLFVRIFRSDTLKGHADRREVGTFWKSNERG